MFKSKADPDFEALTPELKKALNLSIVEGSFSTVMTTVIGGVFLTGFALLMGANDLIIGLLASLPLLANLVQIVGSYIVARVGSSKKVCISYLLLHRLIWVLIIILPLLFIKAELTDLRLWFFIILLGLASIFASICSVSWTSWMADLVPVGIRGRFFAKRNMIAQIVGMIVVVIAGWFIDYWKGLSQDTQWQGYGFIILFAVGTIFGIVCIFLLKKTTPSTMKSSGNKHFFKQLLMPLANVSFRRFIIFASCWGFSVSIVSPFFSVYMIKNLQIPFSLITIFGVVSGITGILGMRLWGKFIDRFGPKPLFVICALGASIIPFLWIFATPENYAILWVINTISGFWWAGIGLASSTMMINLAPQKRNAVYFAVFAAITGLTGALAPIVGGYLGMFFASKTILGLSGLKLLFITSSSLRLLSITLLKPVQIHDNATIKEIMEKFNIWQKLMPIYNLQRFSPSNINYRGNLNYLMIKGMLNIQKKVEKMKRITNFFATFF